MLFEIAVLEPSLKSAYRKKNNNILKILFKDLLKLLIKHIPNKMIYLTNGYFSQSFFLDFSSVV